MKPIYIWSSCRTYKERDPLRTTTPLCLWVNRKENVTCSSCINSCKEDSPCFRYKGKYFIYAEYEVFNLLVNDVNTMNAVFYGLISK